TAQTRVFDVHGVEVDRAVISDGSRRVRTDWVPKLAEFGWYRALIEVHTDNELVGIRTLDFFWAPPPEDIEPSPIFGIAADATNAPIANAVGALANGARVGSVSLNVWGPNSKPTDFDLGGKIPTALNTLTHTNIEVSIGFHEVPIALANALAVDSGSVLDVFASPMDRWNQWGGQLLDRYGQSITQWCFGSLPTEEPVSKLDAQLETVYDEFARFIPSPIVSVPWSDDRPIDPVVARRHRGLRLVDRGNTGAGSMPMLINEWVNQSALGSGGSDQDPMLTLLLHPADHEGFVTDTWSAVGSLSRKALAFWWAAGKSGVGLDRFRLLLADAWTVTPGKRGQVMPAPELHVWRTIASRLAGRHPIEELALLDGTRILLISPRAGEPQTEGAMIVWLEDPRLGNATSTSRSHRTT
ncbi:MAG: hypothetical protein JKY96_08245, partial [Phycisphaerales bacterium]|nr:hypothetical protein [Phycisphaerales bacterium]